MIIRGTLHGTKLRLSGTTVSQANMNTIIGTAVFTVTGINITYYSLSQLLSQTLPKVASLGCTGYLAFATGLSIAAGNTFNYGALPGYCGRAFLTVRSPGGGSGFYARILSFTVGNGTTALYTIYSQEATTLSAETGPVELAMDQLFHTFQITNPSTVTGTTDTNLVAADYL